MQPEDNRTEADQEISNQHHKEAFTGQGTPVGGLCTAEKRHNIFGGSGWTQRSFQRNDPSDKLTVVPDTLWYTF